MVDVRAPVVTLPLTPDRVAQAEFGNSFRGFDPSQVRGFLARVAAEVQALLDREAALADQVAELEERAASGAGQELDEHRLTELLGAETARVLEVARDAANALRANAEQQAAAALGAAETEAVQLRAQAEALLDERAAAAEAEATRLLADAELDAARIRDDAESIRAQARIEAEDDLAQARDEGRRMVAEARAVRERILTDMARRRNLARQQLERLRVGRERLLDAIDGVRQAIEGASGELSDAVVEAKIAGDRAARQVDVDMVPSMSELDAEVDLAKDAGLIDLDAIEREVAGAAGGGTGDDRSVDEEAVSAEPAAGSAEPPVSFDRQSTEPFDWTDVVAEFQVDSTDTVQRFDVDSTDPVQRFDVDSTQTASAPVDTDPPPTATDGPGQGDGDGSGEEAAAPELPARRQGFSSAVDDVFSRWKQDEGDDTAPTMAPTPTTDPSGPTEPEATSEPPAPAPAADAAAAAVAPGGVDEARPGGEPSTVDRQTRDAVLAGTSRDLTRHLKLALSDEQNLVLEGQRDDRARAARPPIPDLLDELAGSDRYEQAARRELLGALEAGWAAVGPGGDAHPDPELLDPVAAALVELLTGPLRERLRRALEDGGDTAAVAERVRNLYRETRNEQAGPLAEHAALAAYAAGQYGAAGVLAGADVRVRWAFEDCTPDCLDNQLAGALSLGSSFPTEHRHPPAFPGCRCLLVVESVEVAMTRDAEGARGHFPATAV